MLGEKWSIYWNEYASDTYLYGSEIEFHKKDDVEFINRLMPPGTVIKQWYSKTNFQMQHIELTICYSAVEWLSDSCPSHSSISIKAP